MQNVTQEWEQTNRDILTRPANVILTVHRTDGTSPIVGSNQLISFNYNKSGDCLSGILTQDTITFTFDNSDGRFDYDPENDIYTNASVNVYCGFMDSDYETYSGINGGFYYISDIDAANTKTTFVAKTILAFMKAKCSVYSGNCYDVAIDILTQAGNDKGVPAEEISYQFDRNIMENVSVSITSDDNYSMAEALQLIANACCCVLYVDRTGAIVIRRLTTTSENYVLSERISYEFPKLKIPEKIGVIKLYYNHGSGYATNSGSARKAGGTLSITNPILTNEFDAIDLARYTFNFQQDCRSRISGNFRADPRIDIFDVIVVPVNRKAPVAVVTKINFTFNGAWRGTYEVVEIGSGTYDLRIYNIEMLTTQQLSSIPIESLCPNTITDIDGDYMASSDGELALWEEDDE